MNDRREGYDNGEIKEVEFTPTHKSLLEGAARGEMDVYVFRARKRKIVNILSVDRNVPGKPNDWDRWQEEIWAGAWRGARARGFADSNYEKAKRPISRREAKKLLKKAQATHITS